MQVALPIEHFPEVSTELEMAYESSLILEDCSCHNSQNGKI